MANLTANFSSRLSWFLVLAACLFLLPSCAKRRAEEIDKSLAQNPKYKELRSENKELLQSLESLEDEIAKTKLQMLEKEAQVKALEKRLNLQQTMLDEAIQEVVRTKAKLRSLESKAEAASDMAEAEIAVKALKAKLAGQSIDPEIAKAEQLLQMSVKEFERENYGGALYLTTQAKSQIKTAEMRLGGRKMPAEGRKELQSVAGEALFAQPIPLQALKNSNLRQLPDLKSNILATVEKGTPLTGYSYKDQWVRVTMEDGTDGWIFQTLVVGR
jgi:predicted RNase H-like nuclease (RuvC/YqgF family)